MSILVVGSVAYDSVKTPFGAVERALGGSATYFSVSASFFAPVAVVAVVGDDFSGEDFDVFRQRGIDTSGITRSRGKSFFWRGEYGFDLNEAHTLATDLNVFADFQPHIPEDTRDCPYVFLANIDPELQWEVLEQVRKPRLVACDTMNFWIERKPEQLKKLLGRVDLLLVNDAEVRQLAGESNLVRAASRIRAWGPRTLVVKRGEYGVAMFSEEGVFAAPGYPLEDVFDPTGAGDAFAGGFIGYLASRGACDNKTLRQAIVVGSVMGSFNVEDFSLRRMLRLQSRDIEARYQAFRALTHFTDVSAELGIASK